MTRIDVDFNSVGRDGLIKVSRRRADADFAAGQVVEVFDPSEADMAYLATVESVEPSGRALVRVHWHATTSPAMSWVTPRSVFADLVTKVQPTTEPVVIGSVDSPWRRTVSRPVAPARR